MTSMRPCSSDRYLDLAVSASDCRCKRGPLVSCSLSMTAGYDVFLSHAWADGEGPRRVAEALAAAGLRVWFDATQIDDFASITQAVADGLAQSKVFVAYYSKTYPRPFCGCSNAILRRSALDWPRFRRI